MRSGATREAIRSSGHYRLHEYKARLGADRRVVPYYVNHKAQHVWLSPPESSAISCSLCVPFLLDGEPSEDVAELMRRAFKGFTVVKEG